MALVTRNDTSLQEENKEENINPQENNTQKPPLWKRIFRAFLWIVVLLVIFLWIWFWRNIQSSFVIIADNPTDESVTFSFDGMEYTLAPHSQEKIDIKPYKTYEYAVGDEKMSLKNSPKIKAHFLNPTKSTYVQINEIYCLDPESSTCKKQSAEKVDIFTIYHYYVDDNLFYWSEIPENTPECPVGIDDETQVSDEEYFAIMDSGWCYVVNTKSSFQIFPQDIYIQGNWDLDVGKPLPREVNLSSVGRRWASYTQKYKIHSTVLSEEDFDAYMQELSHE